MEDKKQKQREAVKRYEQKHDRININFTKGTRDRIEATGLNCSPSVFIQFATEFMLNYLERCNRNEE